MTPEGGGSHPYLGGVFLVAGAGTLTLAFLPGALLSIHTDLPSVQGVPGEVAVVAVLGLAFLAAGVRFLGGTPTASGGEREGATSAPPVKKDPDPDPPISPTGTAVQRTGDRPGAARTEEEKQMDALEEKIKAIDRRMSQAKVKLGTGELSPEGYQKVMEELEEKRAKLEKQRVDLELDQSDL